jgi:putative ABC transport system permease protein
MIKNYFKIAWRNFWKSKLFSFINLSGLTLGITFSLLIVLWVTDERSIDSFHANSSRLFNIYEREYADGNIEIDYSTPGLLAEEMKKKMPEVEFATSYAQNHERTFKVGDIVLKRRGQYATEDFFKVFSFTLLYGQPQNVLSSPQSIALSKEMANDFFGSAEAALGKTIIRSENKDNFTITAIFEVPQNSSKKFDYLINWQNFLRDNSWAKDFDNTGPFLTVSLKNNADVAGFRNRIKNFLDNYGITKGTGYKIELDMQRYDEMYLHASFKNGRSDGGRITYVRLFSILSVFILLIACINFMNLTTARSIKRAREIGIRKVVGAVKRVLVLQFLGEALMLTFLAMLGALALVHFLLPAFNNITGKQIMLPLAEGSFWLKLFAITFVTGMIAGGYPAFFVSSFQPVKILKTAVKFGTGAALFRKSLVVFQFTLSILLIVGTIVVSKQVSYIRNKNIGFNRENLIYLPLNGELKKKYEVFKEQALELPGISRVTLFSNVPTDIDNYTTGVEWEGKNPDLRTPFAHAAAGYDFISTMKAELVSGRDFSKNHASDSASYIINETAAKKIGYKNPVGSPLSLWEIKGSVIGVVKDFHFRSFHETVKPLIIRFGEKEGYGNILVRTEAGKTTEVLANLKKLCKQLNPEFPFSYQFSDEEFQKLYKSEMIVDSLSRYFAILGIFISCLGLLGLVIFTAEQRTKEIGIRKVLGATSAAVFALLSRDFLKLIIMALVIATPLAWWATNKWLEAFEYRVDVSWWMFVIAGLVSIIIALAIISFQAVKTAVANPIKSLRTE